ncbi:YjgN family protein [Roseivivax jejudonensis]|nr:DUF898 family protein [Roseivivax jejudonensis]
MTDMPPPLPARHAAPRYTGEGPALFRLGLVTGLLTFVTLGIYRFWAKTRIRRFIWSAAELDGSRFEYTGTGLEKFLGFLVAVVFLAVYLGLVQIALVYVGLNLFSDPETPQQAMAQLSAFYITFLAVVPFLFFAIYRARRYKLARTRWRGIRFGMEKGAWGYVLRAIGYWTLTILTLGVLLPLQTFHLTKYMTDRSWFGDARFVQKGRWTALYRPMQHIFIGLLFLVLPGLLIGLSDAPFGAFLLFLVGFVWFGVGLVVYRVQSFAYLTRNTVLAEGDVALDARPSTGRLIKLYLLGALVISVGIAVFSGVVSAAGSIVFGGLEQMLNSDAAAETVPFAALIAPLAVGGLSYLAIMVVVGAATLALITQPILAHFVTTLDISGMGTADRIRQRVADQGADAEGFADALDIGGAI